MGTNYTKLRQEQMKLFSPWREVLRNVWCFNFKEDNIMTDKTLVCTDCGSEFVFTVGEQEFYKEKGFDNEPKRCVPCRRAKKEQNNRR